MKFGEKERNKKSQNNEILDKLGLQGDPIDMTYFFVNGNFDMRPDEKIKR